MQATKIPDLVQRISISYLAQKDDSQVIDQVINQRSIVHKNMSTDLMINHKARLMTLLICYIKV